MNIVESITVITDTSVRARLQCGHYVMLEAGIKPGMAAYCPECEANAVRAELIACTPEQLQAVADAYAQAMIEMGVTIGAPERVAILRAARIQDAWRVAFIKALE